MKYCNLIMILKTFTNDGKQIKKGCPESSNELFPLLINKGTCQYNNLASLEKIGEENSISNQIKISNRLCRENGQFMEKITVIKFNNEIITLKDRYRFIGQPANNIDQNLQKRVHIFKKPLHIQNKNEGKKRVTKNLPKNFIKAFLNYLEQVKDETNSQLLECKMKLFTSRQKYNNSFIQRIIDDPQLQQYFTEFLNNHAKQWIENSKIRDKNVHYEAIQIFKKLSANKGEKREQGLSQVDSFLSSFQDNSQRLSSLQKQQNESDKQSIIANSSKSEDSVINQQQ